MTSPSGREPSQIGFSVEGTLFFLVDLNLFSFVWRLSLKIQNMDQPKPHSVFFHAGLTNKIFKYGITF